MWGRRAVAAYASWVVRATRARCCRRIMELPPAALWTIYFFTVASLFFVLEVSRLSPVSQADDLDIQSVNENVVVMDPLFDVAGGNNGTQLPGVDAMYSVSLRRFIRRLFEAHKGEKGTENGPCGCYDLPQVRNPVDPWNSCSDPRAADGDMQLVISYSLFSYSDFDPVPTILMRGVHLNALKAAELYPDWAMRIYIARRPLEATEDLQHACAHLCYLRRIHTNLQLCDVSNFSLKNLEDTNPMMWRFLPIVDKRVSTFISRDLDSLLEKRERSAVRDWLENTNKTLHVMRDHHYHYTQILGGMWGMRWKAENHTDTELGENLRRNRMLFIKMLRKSGPRQEKGRDQRVLARVIWPHFLRARDFIDHSSHFCGAFAPQWVAFPEERDRSSIVPFVGAPIVGTSATKYAVSECPMRCRPPDHQDWKFC